MENFPWSTRHTINITGGTEKCTLFLLVALYFYNVGSFDNLKYSPLISRG